MILSFAHENVVGGGRDGHPLDALELSIARAPRAERLEEGAIRVEDLHTIVAIVSHW